MSDAAKLTIQALIFDLLSADPYFANFDIQRLAAGQVEQPTTAAWTLLVLMPESKIELQEIPGPHNHLTVGVKVKWNGLIANPTPPGGAPDYKLDNVDEYVDSALHQNPLDELAMPLVSTGIQILERGDNFGVKQCNFETGGGIDIQRPQVASVIISGTGTITLSCATGGAGIWYTLDGSHPSPRHGTLYSGPFALASGQTVTATAWLAGYLGTAEATYTRP